MNVTIQKLKEMMAADMVKETVALANNFIIDSPEATKEEIAEAYYIMGNAYRRLADWRHAINCYCESKELNPDGPAAIAYDNALEVMDYYNHDMYNP